MSGVDRFEPAGLAGRADPPVHARPGRSLSPRLVAWIGLPVVALFFLLTAINLGGKVVLWENAHWTAAGALAFAFPASVAWRAAGSQRLVATLVAVGTGAWLIGQLLWDGQIALGVYAFPAPSDVGFLLVALPVAAAIIAVIRGRLPQAEELSVYLDALAIFLAITAVIMAIQGTQVAGAGMLSAAVAVTYPIIHLATAGAALSRSLPCAHRRVAAATCSWLGSRSSAWPGSPGCSRPSSSRRPPAAWVTTPSRSGSWPLAWAAATGGSGRPKALACAWLRASCWVRCRSWRSSSVPCCSLAATCSTPSSGWSISAR